MKKTLGLTGLTMNAMALIAPGAFLWLTFAQQCQYGQPMAGCAVWFGIVVALVLCFATAIAYAELSKLYPGAGSSYFFAEQAFLSKTRAFRFARLAKYIVGWASHMYYWVYPGVMVGVTAILVGYLAGQLMPDTFNNTINSPTLMIGFCVLFSFGVAYIAYRGVNGTTGVNVAVNVIQIAALLLFSFIAIGYRMSHQNGVQAYQLDPDGNAVNNVLAMDKDGKPIKDEKTGQYRFEQEKGKAKPFLLEYNATGITQEPVDKDKPNGEKQDTFQYHTSALSVIKPHGFSYAIIQACIAILILVGFESVTSLGEEAKNAKRDIPRAVLLSLFIQGVVCYLIEYFAAGYFLNPGYTSAGNAASSSAPIGDMMVLAGTPVFGSPTAGWWFMFGEAVTVFLALIGTTLSCITTGARVTYAMGRDDEVPSHFGLLHGRNLTPHRAIWTLAAISAVIGIFAVLLYLCGAAVPDTMNTALTDAQKHSIWYPSFLLFSADTAKGLPNSLLIVTLASNFGTFMLYGLTCIIAIVAFREHHSFSGIKHFVIPVIGVVANLGCMAFYVVGPFCVSGMSMKEPYIALGVAAVWGLYGWWYFARSSKIKGRAVLVAKPVNGDDLPVGAR
ncbi:MAG: APC family permease [Thermoguttaceae bacterium]